MLVIGSLLTGEIARSGKQRSINYQQPVNNRCPQRTGTSSRHHLTAARGVGSGLGVCEIGAADGQGVVVSTARGTHGVVVTLTAELAALPTGGMAGTGGGLGVGAVAVGVGDGLLVGTGVAGGGVGRGVVVGVAGDRGPESIRMGRPPLPLVPGGTGPGAEGCGTTPVR